LGVLTVVVGLVVLAAAAFFAVRGMSRVHVVKPPPGMEPVVRDTAYSIFRRGITHKAGGLRVRCRMKLKQLGMKLTPALDSMSRGCDSAITALLLRVAAFDSVARPDRRAWTLLVKVEYDSAKALVNRFTRHGTGLSPFDEDSLERELRELISD
jgi:hypothetical protein